MYDGQSLSHTKWECKVVEGHLMPDHVHILISIPPKYSVSQAEDERQTIFFTNIYNEGHQGTTQHGEVMRVGNHQVSPGSATQMDNTQRDSMMGTRSTEIMSATERNIESGWAEGHGTGLRTGEHEPEVDGMMSGAGGLSNGMGNNNSDGSHNGGGMSGGMGASEGDGGNGSSGGGSGSGGGDGHGGGGMH